MAQTASILKLSGSTNGRGIKITTTATPGDLLHTSHLTDLDEIELSFTNTQAAAVKVTLEWGGVLVPDDLREITIPGESGAVLMVPGWLLTGGLLARAFAAVANVIIVDGKVIRWNG